MADYRYDPFGRRDRYDRNNSNRDWRNDMYNHHHHDRDHDHHHDHNHDHYPSCPNRPYCDRYQGYPRGWRFRRYDD